jgi:hypothetical protein
MISLIQRNAQELRELHEAIHRTYRVRSLSKSNAAAWTQACEVFHSNYDRLAFPGGLTRAYDQLRKADAAIIEAAIVFLEADPYFFRSGYVKADLVRAVSKFPLSPKQQMRLQQVIIDRIKGPTRREFRRYCNLAPHVTTPAFEREVAALANTPDQVTARNASWVLEALRRSVKSPSGAA